MVACTSFSPKDIERPNSLTICALYTANVEGRTVLPYRVRSHHYSVRSLKFEFDSLRVRRPIFNDLH